MEKKPINLPHDKLLEALFFFWDAFERSSLNFFLTKETADQIKAGKPLTGDRLTFGIRKMEWNANGRILKGFMEHEKVIPKKLDGNTLLFTYKYIPVYLTIYEDNPCITSFDVVFYNNETFNTPNPLSTFNEKYDK